MSYGKLLEEIAAYLYKCFGTWKESSFYDLSKTNREGWVCYSQQILSKVLSYFASLVGEGELLEPDEIKGIKDEVEMQDHTFTISIILAVCMAVAKSQAAKSKAIQMARTKCSDVYDRTMKKGGYYDCV